MGFKKTGKTTTLGVMDKPPQDQERKAETQPQDKPKLQEPNNND